MQSARIKLDIRHPRIGELVAPEAPLAQLASGLAFTEGPVWHEPTASLIFSDIIGDAQYRWSASEGLQILRAPSNMANGNTLDAAGRLLTCEHTTSRVVRTEPDGTHRVLASHYAGKELNSPNDIVVDRGGAIYFTDPLSGRSARYGLERASQLGFQGVYRMGADGQGLTLLADDFELPNGLCLDHEERRLFVNDTRRGHIRAFTLRDDGALRDDGVWAELTGEGEGAPDGMKFDAAGNLWCTGPGGIHIFAPDATCLGVLRLPERAANFAWGGPGWNTLYITATSSVYAVGTHVLGLRR